jgi:cytochrome d ubiquinol oxidase subunit I
MDELTHITLSRFQFAFTAMFHILWPVFIIGVSIFLIIFEALWVKTGKEIYYRHARFWTRLFLLNVAVGVVTGIPMEFQFGTNWNYFSQAGGDFLGHMLGYEAAMAFMLEASFLGIMVFGWKRVSPKMHLFATAMVAFGASLSAFWIMVANSWMHTPTGGYFENVKFTITSHTDAIFNPDMFWGVSHMWAACLEISLFVIGGLSAWYILKKRDIAFFLTSFKIAAASAILIAPLQIWLGDGSGISVYQYQPAKLAAMEAHWETNPPGEAAPWLLAAWPDVEKERNAWQIAIPYGLSLISTRSLTGQVQGLRDVPKPDRPPVALNFYSFRIMVAAGFALFFLIIWTLWAWHKGRLTTETAPAQKALLWCWIAGIPLSYAAMETGWIVREVGRQPWVIYGLMRTGAGASELPAAAVGLSMSVYSSVYALLFILFIFFSWKIVKKGPDLESPVEVSQKSRKR